MIILDRRETDIIPLLRPQGACVADLEYGDCMFSGNRGEEVITVGIERKKVDDLINSIATGRLMGHQIPGLVSSYEKCYLIVEGEWREGGEGLEVKSHGRWRGTHGKRRWTQKDVWGFLTSVEECGVGVRITGDITNTVSIIVQLERWWGKKWGEHKSHLQMKKGIGGHPSPFLRTRKAGLVERVAVELPHVGMNKAGKAAIKFKSVEDMILASEEEWREIEGIGPIVAREIVRSVKGGV